MSKEKVRIMDGSYMHFMKMAW